MMTLYGGMVTERLRSDQAIWVKVIISDIYCACQSSDAMWACFGLAAKHIIPAVLGRGFRILPRQKTDFNLKGLRLSPVHD